MKTICSWWPVKFIAAAGRCRNSVRGTAALLSWLKRAKAEARTPMAEWCRPKACATIAMGLTLAAMVMGAAEKPNIVFLLADDLGYGDIGCFGQTKIRTPNIDRLAKEGVRFTQHYSGNAVCAPSRCVLMTGKHPGHAFVRDNREVQPEGQWPLPAATVTLPRLLQANGYVTGAFGKWGLGAPGSSGEPLMQGFDHFYGYNCQRRAHNYYPTNLWEDDQRVALNNPDFSAHQKLPEGLDPKNPASYTAYSGRDYAPDLIAEKARQFIRANKERPFFLYFPTTVPHLALQVPEDSLKDYLGKWPEEPYTGGKGYLPQRAPRSAYAAMITRLDREIGRFVELVKELGLEQKTIFIFTSDNGPLYENLGGTDTEFFNSAGNLRGRKGSLFEGGFRVPLVVRWTGRIASGGVSDRVTGFEDWLPTLLELAGAERSLPGDVDGISFAPTLLGKAQSPRPFLYREFPAYGGYQALRVGDWKAVRTGLKPAGKKAAAKPQLSLFDLSTDPHEEKDVSSSHLEVVSRMEKIMREQHTASADYSFPALDREAR